jgi:nucleoside-diphosphate-sugar epimerase
MDTGYPQRMSELTTTDEVAGFMTEPSEGLIDTVRRLEGGVVVIGAGGKMGGDLLGTLVRADRAAGRSRRVVAVSRFTEAESRQRLEAMGVEIVAGDLTDRVLLDLIPRLPNAVYMAGLKFGSSQDWRSAFHMNCIVPYLVGVRLPESRIVVFSSGNPYPPVHPDAELPTEETPLEPHGIYGWTIAGREAAFATTARECPGQQVCLFRLMYAQHLLYGVLVDLAGMVWREEAVSLEVPAVNLVSQRDAIDVALRCLTVCANPPEVVNCGGPRVLVRDIAERMAALMGKEARFASEEGRSALIAEDAKAVRLFGPYRDGPDDMIEAAVRWVMAGGATWDKPTMFGRPPGHY